MAYLISKFGFSGEPRLQIAGEEVYFPLRFGNNWQSLRVGVLFSSVCVGLDNNQGDVGLNRTIYGVSVCRGYKGYFDPSPDDCFAMWPGKFAATIGLLSTAAIPYAANFNNGVCLAQKHSAYSVYSEIGNNTACFLVDWFQQHQSLSAFYYDFDRATTPGSMRGLLYAPSTVADARVHRSYQQFIIDMSTPAPVNTNNPAPVQALVYAGTANIFDTVSLFTNVTASSVWHVAAVAVIRWS